MMGIQPDHPNNPAYDPDPWTECEWGDGCHAMVHEDADGAPLCWQHYMKAIEEDAAETANKMAKEDW